MNNIIKLVIINHSFQVYYFYRRWQLFAQNHKDIDVTLLAPEKSKWYNTRSYTFGDRGKVIVGKEIEEENFHIKLIRKRDVRSSNWYSPDFKKILLSIHPDIVYHIGSHTQLSLVQVIRIVKKYLPDSKVIAFSMRGPHHNLNVRKIKGFSAEAISKYLSYQISKFFLNYVNKNCAAFFCHYPDALQAFKDEGFCGPIYMQTQVGVNKEWFYPDEISRNEIRAKYNISDSTCVFGSATRFSPDKGILDILTALPKDGNWRYLMMGSGSLEDTNNILRKIKELGISNKVIVTGFVDWYEIGKYWNAVDCAIHVPHTTKNWVETFSLSAVQPQAVKKPIIGNTSGSVPYQVGFPEMIVQEGDIEELRTKIQWVIDNRNAVSEIGNRMYTRTMNGFEIQHLNELFYHTLVEDVFNNKYDKDKIDMTKYQVRK